ncbi:hypothetical protein [Methanolobus halotolerans]|uniref:Uncharacterized protein n=1 Tax=Methanolobus halotolerans TaxID=2052935 RepID=A0A4E0QAI9_9EURY|nr:hypothetical protein [Methanolobus halotolerans]TGC09467.1 hypothetical protein CUN85_06460 [Methanolobus halotolerans]
MGFFGLKKKDADDEAREIELKIIEYMEELSSKHPLFVANALKKCVSNMGFADDIGFIKLASNSQSNLYYTGDILLISSKRDLDIGEILEHGFFTESGYLELYSELKSFNREGYLNVFSLNYKEDFIILPTDVTGILLKVIPFYEDEWYDLFEKSVNDYSSLRESIEDSIEFYENLEDEGDKQNIQEVLSSRIKVLDEKEEKQIII